MIPSQLLSIDANGTCTGISELKMACSQKPKILYFDGKGRAETARILLAQAGIDFDDERISFDEWQKKKVGMCS